jgi:oligoribonuclease NrnB/cAMP/cGMP phosphodiesterase (DHH superfamily)
MDMVIYHGGGCNDGFCCAWLAHWAFPDAEFVPAQYGQEPPDVAGKRVLIADFSYKRPAMRQILSRARHVTVLDHHKSAEAELAGIVDEFVMRPDLIANPPGSELPLIWFDMARSGGRLTWEWLCRNGHGVADPDNPPWIVDFTQDRDLWSWRLPDSREVNAALSSYPMTFDEWDRLAELGHEALIPEGRAILRYQAKIVEQHVGHARLATIGGHEVLVVNATCLFSEVAGELARGRPFGVAYFDRADGKRQFSLRSRGDDGIDVSEVAGRFGGGGHRASAGFELPIGVDPQ